MRIYLNDSEITANILGSENEVLDETLDTFSFCFLSSSVNAVNPMAMVKIVNDDNSVSLFVVTSDSVEPFSLSKQVYKHSISCVENTRILSKYMVRNTVFSQPPSKWRSGWCFQSAVAGTTQGDGRPQNPYYYGFIKSQYCPDYGKEEPLTFSSREKCGRAFVRINAQFGVAKGSNQRAIATSRNDFHTLSQITALGGDVQMPGNLVLHYTKNGNDYTEDLVASDFAGGQIRFNEDLELPMLSSIVEDGGNDFYITSSTVLLFYGMQYPTSTSHIEFYSVQIELRAEVYYYSCLDILGKLLQRQRQTHTIAGSQVNKDDPFRLPLSGDLWQLLRSTIAPNFTFTQCTLYECVAEVFRIFDAIFTMDEDGYLGITYFNERNGRKVTPTATGINVAIGEERYVNGLISYYQDARIEENFPPKGNYAPARCSSIGVPTSNADHCFIVPHKIDIVTKAELKASITVNTNASGTYNQQLVVNDYPLDISRYVIEKSVWSSSLSTTSAVQTADPSIVVQNNSVYYSSGDSKIELGYAYSSSWGITYYSFGNMINCAMWRSLGWENVSYGNDLNAVVSPKHNMVDWSKVFMSVSYVSTADGRLRIESQHDKFEGEMMLDQSNGAVDLGRMGLSLLGLSYRMGEPALCLSHRVASWANRIKKGDIYEWRGETWIANSCNYTILGNGYYQGKIGFVKNFNELSLRTRLLREKRLSNVASELTMKSEDNLVEYCYFADELYDFEHTGSEPLTIFKQTYFGFCFAKSFGLDTYQYVTSLSYAVFRSNDDYYLPMFVYGAGNAVCFEMSFDSPMIAGINTKSNESGWFGSVDYYSSYLLYADEDGFLDSASIYFGTDMMETFDDDFPKVTAPISSLMAFSINDYKIYKQPNEIFALNYEISFMPIDPNSHFIGKAFIEDNFFINGKPLRKDLYIYYSTTEKYSVMDTKGTGNREKITAISLDDASGPGFSCKSVTFTHGSIMGNVISWAICTAKGDILFAFNGEPGETSTSIYFKLLPSRI